MSHELKPLDPRITMKVEVVDTTPAEFEKIRAIMERVTWNLYRMEARSILSSLQSKIRKTGGGLSAW